MNIDWDSLTSEVLINPRFPEQERASLVACLIQTPGTPGHLWFSTSGSSGHIKWVALSKTAILASAQAVNTFLNSSKEDIWYNVLPSFHVGGLGIFARSHLSGAKVVDGYCTTWNPQEYVQGLIRSKATLSSLVPTQVYDLVQLQLRPPPSLRAIIVGGGALSEMLLQQGCALGWPLKPSYGLTECASQVATARVSSYLEVLPHIHVQITSDGFIQLKSSSLLTLYAWMTSSGMKHHDPKSDGWFTTEDRGTLQGSRLHVLGRDSSFIKIGGESVDMNRLNKIMDEVKAELQITSATDLALVAMPDERLGHVIHVAMIKKEQHVVDTFNDRVMPFEKIRKLHIVDEIPRSPLHKVLKSELLEKIT